MFSDGVLDLYEKGVITGRRKNVNPNVIVASFVMGSQRLYKWLNNNPVVKMARASYVNNGSVIASHDQMMAINSCIQVDLTGQVNADSIGSRIFSGVGGQMVGSPPPVPFCCCPSSSHS